MMKLSAWWIVQLPNPAVNSGGGSA